MKVYRFWVLFLLKAPHAIPQRRRSSCEQSWILFLVQCGQAEKNILYFCLKNSFDIHCITFLTIAFCLLNINIILNFLRLSCKLQNQRRQNSNFPALQVLGPSVVRDVLSLMHSCGMYNYSGHFAFKVSVRLKRIKTEEKAKVVAVVWEKELIHQDSGFCTRMI